MTEKAYQLTEEDLVKELATDKETGLTNEAAQEKLKRIGPNVLMEAKKKTWLQQFIDQFKDVMILILLLAAAVSLGLAIIEGEGFFEPFLILFIVFLNAIIGTVQEGKAEDALDSLKKMSAPKARLIRAGKEQIVEAEELVPGDLIFLEAGDFIPADARILVSSSLKAEESALTGESEPADKTATTLTSENVPIGDRDNMLYSGCSITYGTARAVVTATGMDTEIGKIAELLTSYEDTKTPLQIKLQNLGKTIGFLALGVCFVIFIIGLVNGMPIMDIFLIAVALAVSAIPEGLPAIVTVVLAIGVQNMAKRNAVIRKLPAVETLGSTSVICSDKTGTLTQNKMTLTDIYDASTQQLVDIKEQGAESEKMIISLGVLCSEGKVSIDASGTAVGIGDPTETSIIVAAANIGIYKDELLAKYPRLGTLPFDSDRKMMTSVHEMDGKIIVIVKGAFDVISQRCTSGHVEAGQEANQEMSTQALRVLALATKEIAAYDESLTSEDLERDLEFKGLFGMIDPARPEAKRAIAICRAAGIRPVMITGDHILTASAIAEELGILQPQDQAITGTELSAMNEQQLNQRVEKISVYARVSPEHKIRIIKAWQNRGEVVSMTGDGVNDAPALKAADIGCSMGITGTDVAKGASDMILLDDNFATIVEAVREGRGIYENIRHTVGFLLGTNIGEVLAVLVAMLFWRVSPFLAIHLLWINLITDSLPAIALGMEPVKDDVMSRLPKPKEEGIFAGGLGIRIILQGTMFAILTLSAFLIGRGTLGNLEGARTMAFLVLALSQTFHAFNMRSAKSLRHTGVFTNKLLNGAAAISVLLIAMVLFVKPITAAFSLVSLTSQLYLLGFLLSLIPLVVLEIYKNTLGKKSPQQTEKAGQIKI